MLKVAVFVGIFALAYAQKQAVVYLFDPSGANPDVRGNVTFTKMEGLVLVTGSVKGLKEGKHGFHIHQKGNIAEGCIGTGGHFNPHNQTHGAPEDKVRHVGDLGNINADSFGVATLNIRDSIIDLEGEHSIIGRAVVVHGGEDDLGKGPNPDPVAGNAGPRVACGVIGIHQN